VVACGGTGTATCSSIVWSGLTLVFGPGVVPTTVPSGTSSRSALVVVIWLSEKPASTSAARASASDRPVTSGSGSVPVESRSVNAVSGAACEPPAGLTSTTVPSGSSEGTCSVLTAPVKPAFLMLATASSRLSPTTFGTGSVSGPAPMTRSTFEPSSTDAPLAGSELMTLPCCSAELACVVTSPTVRPACSMSCRAVCSS
jgi:hypothetical protein